MRALAVAVLTTSLTAFAQHENGGVWTGYVGGWKPNAAPPAPVMPVFNPPVARPRGRAPVVIVPVPVATTSVRQERDLALEAEQRRAWDAEQARLAQQTQLENERRLAAEREALLQQQLEYERRMAADREAMAVARAKLEQEAEARRLLAAAPPPAPPEPPKPAAPWTPGNDVYRWTDAEGVVHYSTSVPPEARATAKKVGSR